MIIIFTHFLKPLSSNCCQNNGKYILLTEVIESFFLAESESEYYSSIRKFLNPNPNIIRDFKKDSNIFESLKRFEYSSIIRIIQLYLNKMWKIKSRKHELREHIQKATLRAAVTVTSKHRSCPSVPANRISRSAGPFFESKFPI